jgi:phage tail sheath gpL-like
MALTSIIANDNKVPGTYIRVSLGAGARSAADSTQHVVLFGNKTSDGSMVVETEYDCFSIDEARSLAGNKSELACMAEQALLANPGCSLKLMAITESAGTKASATITIGGAATATTAGTVEVSVRGRVIEVGFAAGDTLATIATAVRDAINNMTFWPVVASVASAVVTVTAANFGPRGNFISLRTRIIESGTGITSTASAGYLASGATSDSPATALAVQAGLRRKFLVCPYSDSTNIGSFKSHVDAQDEPEIGARKWVICATHETIANTTTLATGINFPRVQLAWMRNSDMTPGEIAAGVAAFRAMQESTAPRFNYDGVIIPGFLPHYSKSDIATNSQLKAALNNGITPLATVGAGEVNFVRCITTKSQDTTGKPDYRVLDIHKVVVPDYAADVFEVGYPDRFGGMAASDDPAEGKLPPADVATPSIVRDYVFEVLNALEGEGSDSLGIIGGLLDLGSVAANEKQVIVELSKISQGRFNINSPINVIELAHQFAHEIRQTG